MGLSLLRCSVFSFFGCTKFSFLCRALFRLFCPTLRRICWICNWVDTASCAPEPLRRRSVIDPTGKRCKAQGIRHKLSGFRCQQRESPENEKGFASYGYLLQTLGVLVEAATGFEPVNNGFADRCLTTWLCRPASKRIWSGKRDSNPRQPRWQRGALPAELFPPVYTHSIL